MNYSELLPFVNELPHADKLQLMHVLLRHIAAEENINLEADNTAQASNTDDVTIKTQNKILIQDLVPRQVEVFEPLSRDKLHER